MLFNSFEFIFLFLPITVVLYFVVARWFRIELALAVLVIASLFFYGFWNPNYLPLILFSIAFNYFFGKLLASEIAAASKWHLAIGVAVNLGLLAYFKYANFFVDNLGQLLGTEWHLKKIFLPLAISFFTFQQISYLVDTWQGKTREYNFLHYSLFVCFFPQLIAGPIVHHKEMLPQFMRRENLQPLASNFAVGLGMFAMGLFKKTVIADSLSDYVVPVYDSADAVASMDFFVAWGSTLAYTFQLYFDFSGYSDMALGCARLFGIKLPVNFFSPYKACSIVDFWRRWHITLSRFLRDYLYVALGGNQHGKARRYLNLAITMLLGGLWHGAGWNFVIWGGLHGAYLVINHAWSRGLRMAGFALENSTWYRILCWTITFLAVVVSWVYFRAPTLEQANAIIWAMAGGNGAVLPAGIVARLGDLGAILSELGIATRHGGGATLVTNFIWVAMAAVIALFSPNVVQIFHNYEPALFEKSSPLRELVGASAITWGLQRRWSAATAMLTVFGLLTLMQVSEFLYFQF